MKLVTDLKFDGYEEPTLNRPLTFKRQSLEEVLDAFDNCKLEEPGNFFSENFMVSFKEAKNKPDWKPEYKDMAQVKRLHMCKSCKGKAMKGCCPEYSPKNRVMIKMIVGWDF